MPNWCSNILIVEGDNGKVKNFTDFAKNHIVYSDGEEDTPLDFNKFVPYPDEKKHQDEIRWIAQDLRQLDEKGKKDYIRKNRLTEETLREVLLSNLENEDSDILGWHTTNWGTKWNARYVQFKEVDEKTSIYYFDTAWSPPIPVFAVMSMMYPDLTFTLLCGEEGHFFSCFIRAKGKNVIENRQTNYKNNWAYPKTLMKKYKLQRIGDVKWT